MTDTFLLQKDVEFLTGIKGRKPEAVAKQTKWLKENRIKHWVNPAMRVVVPRAIIEQTAPVANEPWQPNV